MKHHDMKALMHLLTYIEKIESYVHQTHDYETFSENNLLVDAVVFNLVQIGETAHKLFSNEFKIKYHVIPWHALYGLRNRIVHNYDNVDIKTVYEVITEDLIELKNTLLSIKKST